MKFYIYTNGFSIGYNDGRELVEEREITEENAQDLISGKMLFENGEFIINENFEIEQLKNQKTQIEKELVEVNGMIEGANRLKEIGIFDEDDELDLVGYETKAQELIVKRSGIKAQIKLLK